MPLVLVPIVGPEPVVPIIAISALFTNSARGCLFSSYRWRRSLLALAAAVPFVVVSAYGFTLLTGRAIQFLIGAMLIIRSVALRDDAGERCPGRPCVCGERRRLRSRHGGTVGAGVILLSILMAAGLQGAAVIATDA